MTVRTLWLIFALLLGVLAHASDLGATLLAETPAPAPGDMLAPRAVLADPITRRVYVLDSELRRLTAFTLDGTPQDIWPASALDLDWEGSMPADPMLPIPALGAGGDAVYLLKLNRAAHTLTLTAITGTGRTRTLTIPDQATYGAVALDPEGRALLATLRAAGGKASLELAREDAEGDFSYVAALDTPCDGQTQQLTLTGFTVAPDGRLAIGIAQAGTPGASFIRSWLVQGRMHDGRMTDPLDTTHRFSLLDGRGKPTERFRTQVEGAGKQGYPKKPCVPLFTALAIGPRGHVISGGHTLDPFLRLYGPDGTLLFSQRREAVGGQHLATLVDKGEPVRLFATDAIAGRIAECTLDGRVIATMGRPTAFHLGHPVTLTANANAVYVISRWGGDLHLLSFSNDGTLRWARRLTPPAGMEDAQPLLAGPAVDRVFIGWRQPNTPGVGWVETVMADGVPGLPFWATPYTAAGDAGEQRCPTPLLIGDNGQVFVLREMKGGARLHAFSYSGAFLQQFPTELQGITAVSEDGSMAWAAADEEGIVITRYAPDGVKRGWKRVPRPAADASFLPVRARGLWGWLTSTQSLLRLDNTMTVVDEVNLLTPEGERLLVPTAITGDGDRRIYLAIENRILVITQPE